jgi:repressor LexA
MDRETEILEFIKGYMEEHGWAPVIREIGEGVGITSTSHVAYYLDKLEAQGRIERQSNSARAIRVLA